MMVCPFLLQVVCSNEFVAYIKGEDGVDTIEPLPHSAWDRLEFSVSTEYSGLKYNSKYQMTIEGGHGIERSNASQTFTLSKYILYVRLVSRVWSSCRLHPSSNGTEPLTHKTKCLFVVQFYYRSACTCTAK